MPIYEYRCTQCDHLFDKLQRVDDDEPDCPVCEGKVYRIISTTGLRFKGTGFHCTDYTRYARKDSA